MDIENISEEDLINALGDLSVDVVTQTTTPALDFDDEIDHLDGEDHTIDDDSKSDRTTMQIDSDSINGLATLLKELLKNKTIEITIKIKD